MSRSTNNRFIKHIAYIGCLFFMFITTCCIFSCNKSGAKILSKSKMEDVLYDYHLAQGIIPIESNKGDFDYQKYLNAVYEKHDITKEDFDSSLVYYNHHVEDLQDIYDNLQERFESLEKEIQLETGNNSTSFVNSNDTTNLWNGKKIYVFHSIPSQNKYTYSIKADTSFYKGDKITLLFNVDFVKSNDEGRDLNIISSVSIRFTDGSTVADTRNIYYTGDQQLQISANPAKEIESINGFFYFYAPQQQERSIAVVRNFIMTRTHTLKKEDIVNSKKNENDSIQDTIIKEDVKIEKPITNKIYIRKKVLSPEELRIQSTKGDKNTKIRTAPEVRTPNSIGVRKGRRINR